MPAVDDSPSAQLLVEQASDQSRANPLEAVRLLVQALDSAHDRLVRSAADPELFVPVTRRVHAMLAADPALRTAFRQEVEADAASRLARGELEWTATHRLDAEAGLEASMRLAQSALARGRLAAAAAWLARSEDHDLLAGRRALHHAAMSAAVLGRLGDRQGAAAARARLDAAARSAGTAVDAAEVASARAAAEEVAPGASGCFAALGPGAFRSSSSGEAWSQTWAVPLDPSASVTLGAQPAPPERTLPAPRAAPSVVGERVFVDDGGSVRACDLLSGRTLWTSAIGDGSMRAGSCLLAASADAVIAFPEQPMAMGRSAPVRVACLDPATGAVRWEERLDRLGPGTDLDGLQPQGAPLLVDGRVVVSARRTSARLETASWLVALDLERPQSPAWLRSISATGSVRVGTQRSPDAPVLAEGVLGICTATGAVAVVEPWDGMVRWLRRFPVPVRDASAAASASEVMTPAVVAGVLWAIAPDRSRVRGFSLRDGSVVAEAVTGADSGLGTPAYLVGEAVSGTVLAVGDRVACLDPAAPDRVRWSVPGPDAPFRRRVHGRVQAASGPEPGSAVVLVPDADDATILDARTGAERMVLKGAGNANAVLAGGRMVAAAPAVLTGWMPASDAERIVRSRMEKSTDVADAMAMVHLARQLRSGRIAAEGAEASVARARDLPESSPARAELLDLLLAVDALDLATGGDRERLDRAIDACAQASVPPARAALIRADRALRRGSADDAARLAATAALDPSAGVPVPVRGSGSASVDAEARRIIAAARTSIGADAVARAIQPALRAPGAAGRGGRDAAVARLAAGIPAGDAALLAAASSAASTAVRSSGARLALECRALGADSAVVDRALAAAMPELAPALSTPRPGPPSVAGQPIRIVEFQGRIPRRPAGVLDPPGSLLAMQGSELVLRRVPGYQPAWRVSLGFAEGSVLATVPDIIACDDAPGGSGRLTCVSASGAVRWSSAPTAVDPAPEEAAELDDPRGRAVSVVPMATAPAIAVLRRDGSVVAHDRLRGEERWSLPGDGFPAMAWAWDPLSVALGGAADPESGDAIRVLALDAGSGQPVGSWSPEGTELRWLRVVEGCLLVIATDAGIEARRLAGGDMDAPYWLIDSVDARGSVRAWSFGRWLLVLDRFDAILAIDAWTGRVVPGAFAAPTFSSASPVREVCAGSGWIAAVRDDRVDFFAEDGTFLGRDAAGGDRSYVDAAASMDRLFLLDGGSAPGDGVPLRFGVMLRDLDARLGGMEPAAPVLLRSLGQRIGAIGVIPGAVIASNGSAVHVIEYSSSAPGTGR